MTEEERLKRIREGDYKAVEEICAETWQPLYRFIYYRVQNREEAEDITQEAYVRALSYIRDGNAPIHNTVSFLKTVSLNIIRDRWRKGVRQGICLNIDDLNPQETAVDDETQLSEQRDFILDALRRLNKDQRLVIELRIIKGYSIAETARIMKRSAGAVRSLQYRAIQSLNQILKDVYR